jgi:hypothetical protein
MHRFVQLEGAPEGTLLRRASPDAHNFAPGVLLVLIHGLRCDARVWKTLPDELLDEVKWDIDVLSFHYPSSLLSNISIEIAADDLLSTLYGFMSRNGHHDIIFVAHSAGGLVLRQALLLDDLKGGNVLEQSRQVFNLGVPHFGPKAGVPDWLRRLAVLIGWVCFPITHVVGVVSKGNRHWGRNRIYSQLKRDGRFLRELSDGYSNLILRRDTPQEFDVTSNKEEFASGYNVYHPGGRLPGKHDELPASAAVKLYLSQNINITSLWYKRQPEYDKAVAHMLRWRVKDIEAQTRIKNLYHGSGAQGISGYFDQQACLDKLSVLLSTSSTPIRAVVSGISGVGKSVVLRRLSYDGCDSFLRDPTSEALPLFIPIDRMNLPDYERSSGSPPLGSTLWTAICREWVRLTNTFLQMMSERNELPSGLPQSVPFSWLEQRLRRGRVAVLLDGVDEFVARHSNVTYAGFVESLPVDSAAGLVLGIREHSPSFEPLSHHRYVYLRIPLLTIAMVKKAVPGLADKIVQAKDSALSVLRNPIVVNPLSTYSVTSVSLQTLSAPADFLRFAAQCSLDKDETYQRSLGVDCVALVYWVYHRRNSRELSYETLRGDITKLLEEWRGHTSMGVEGTVVSEQYDTLRVLLDGDNLKFVLRSSLFFRTLRGHYTFSNEVWSNFFVALYLSLCVRCHNARAVRGIALQVNHYEYAGTLLTNVELTEDLISTFISEAKTDLFVMGNLGGLIGVSKITVAVGPIMQLLEACQTVLQPLVRFVVLARLAGRASRKWTDDASAPDIRNALAQMLPRIARESDNSVIRHLCLCGMAEIGITDEGVPASLVAADALDLIQEAIASCVDPVSGSRSIQESLLASQRTIDSYREHSIARVYYLFLLTVLRVNGRAIRDVCEEISYFLRDGCATESFFQHKDSSPYLYAVYLECRKLWKDYCSPRTERSA